MALYETTTDQKINTTWHNPIQFISGLRCRLFNLVEHFTKLGVSVRKGGLLTLSILYVVYCYIHVDAISKENSAVDLFPTSTFRRLTMLDADFFGICSVHESYGAEPRRHVDLFPFLFSIRGRLTTNLHF